MHLKKKGLKEHIKRTGLQRDWLWKEDEKSVAAKDPVAWRWKMKNATFVPKWQPDENITAVEIISKICSCSTTCKN